MAFPTAMHIFTQRKTSAGAGTEVFLPRKGNAYEAWVYLKDSISIKVGKI